MKFFSVFSATVTAFSGTALAQAHDEVLRGSVVNGAIHLKSDSAAEVAHAHARVSAQPKTFETSAKGHHKTLDTSTKGDAHIQIHEAVPSAQTQTQTQMEMEWLDAHNSHRQEWHEDNDKTYVPLQWSDGLEASSLVWALHLAATNQFYHEGQGNPYGENLAMNMGTTGYTEDATPKEVLGRWVDGEVNEPWPNNGHLTAALWRATTWVGCASATSVDATNGMSSFYQVCRYARPGNCNVGNYAGWLEPMLLDTSPCGPECHPDDCPDGLPGSPDLPTECAASGTLCQGQSDCSTCCEGSGVSGGGEQYCGCIPSWVLCGRDHVGSWFDTHSNCQSCCDGSDFVEEGSVYNDHFCQPMD